MAYEWIPTTLGHKYGVAVCNFGGASIRCSLSLRIGDAVQILEECGSWYRGALAKDRGRKGIFPKTFIATVDAVVDNPGQYEVVYPVDDPVVKEITSVLREWGAIWKDLFLDRQMHLFNSVKSIMNELMEYRNQIVHGKLTQDQQLELKTKIAAKIDWGNSKLHLDLVPRINGEPVDSNNASVIELYKLHMASSESASKHKQRDTVRRQSQPVAPGTHHLFLKLKSFMCNVGEPSVLLFGLYNSRNGCYITEKYMARLTKLGMPQDHMKIDKQFAVFNDLTSVDVLQDVYLVCHVFREGKLVFESKKSASAVYRRPFGVAVADISDVISGQQDNEKEHYLHICFCNELEYYQLDEYIIKKQTSKFNDISGSLDICISLKMFHGDLEKVIKDNPLTFSSSVAVTRRLGFPEIILPGYVRNDFFVTINKADFEKGSKSTGKNIEVALCAVSETGQLFRDCLCIGSGEGLVSEYHSYVLYHANVPHWNETVKVSLPIEQFHNAHLRFTFSHCSRNEGKVKGERIFGFSFLKLLQSDGTVLKDGTYDIFVYKMDNSVSFTDVRTYLKLPCTPAELVKQQESGLVYAGPHRNQKECLTIVTSLCSTKLTQNSDLVRLLRWRSNPEGVLDALQAVLKVPSEEFVKFLQDVFDALFNILSDNVALYGMPVFAALVSILRVVEDVKFAHFTSTLNSYIDEHFSATLAYRTLSLSFCQVISQPNDASSKEALMNSMQSLTYLFKMIVRSYLLHRSASASADQSIEFQMLLYKLFDSLTDFMASNSESLNDAKLEALKKLPTLCADMLLVIEGKEFSVCLQRILDSASKSVSSAVQVRKLKCIQDVVKGRLFTDAGARSVLMPLAVEHIQQHFEKKQDLPTCFEMLGDLIKSLHGLDPSDVFGDVEYLSNSLLGTVLNILLTIDRKGEVTGLAVSCLLGILELMNEEHYSLYLRIHSDKSELKDFLKKLVVSFKELLEMDTFQKDWFVLKIVSNNVIQKALKCFSKAFADHFLTDEDFDKQLWDSYFMFAILFITQSSLSLESFSAAKRSKILDRYGDMRQVMGFQVAALWNLLGNKKKHFIPSLIGPFLEMTLIPETELRRATIPLFYDMMKVDFEENGSFDKFESELIENLESLMNKGVGDLEYQLLFSDVMTSRMRENQSSAFHDRGMKCLVSITEILKRLLDYRAATAIEDSTMDQRMMCTVRLLEFYKELDRKDMYINYIYKLCDLHIPSENFTEAGFVLLLHADLLQWSDVIQPKMLRYPKQPEWQRKEQIYLEAIDFFDRGKTWECGIKLCKELALLYETKLVDYNKLSNILRKQACFYDNIIKQLRPAPNYFRVTFFGRGFPHYLKDKMFIYRGLELETLAGFSTRICSVFPGAEILYKNTPPPQSVVQGMGQHIQICNVNPVPGESALFDVKSVDKKIASYYRSNEVSQFVFSRPFHKDKDPDNEFRTLWLERTIHTSGQKFPGILKWSPVEDVQRHELNPLQNAIESIQSKNRELSETISVHETNPTMNINPLSMVLNGVIDANVNGGIANYQKAFLTDEFSSSHAEDAGNIQQLKKLLSEQVGILYFGLVVHEKLSGEALRPFHDKMVMQFSAMQASIEMGQPIEVFLTAPSANQLSRSMSSTMGRSARAATKPHSPNLQVPKSISYDSELNVSTRKGFGAISNIFKRGSVLVAADVTGLSSSPSADSVLRRPTVTGANDEPALASPSLSRRTSFPVFSSDGEPASPLPGEPAPLTRRLGSSQHLATSTSSLEHISEADEPPSLPTKKTKAPSAGTALAVSTDSASLSKGQTTALKPNGLSSASSDLQFNFEDGDDIYESPDAIRVSAASKVGGPSATGPFHSTPGFPDLETEELYDHVATESAEAMEEDLYACPKELEPPPARNTLPPARQKAKSGSRQADARDGSPLKQDAPKVSPKVARSKNRFATVDDGNVHVQAPPLPRKGATKPREGPSS